MIVQGDGLFFLDVSSRGSVGSFVVQWSAADNVKDNVDTNQIITTGAQREGVIDNKFDGDWYELAVTSGVTYTITVQGDGTAEELAEPELQVLNEFGTMLEQSYHPWGGAAKIVWTAEESGLVYLAVGGSVREVVDTDIGSFVIAVTSDQRVLSGTRRSDNLTGGDNSTYLSGAAGNDTLRGGGVNDTVVGGVGDDSLGGDDGRDRLAGGEGADILVGGADADTLIGGAGADQLAGEAGADRFVFQPLSERDVIMDFEDGVDRIVLWSGVSFDDLAIRGSGPNAVIAVGSVEIVLFGFSAQDVTRADFVFM